ncbi:MAG: hypothetical protein QNL04_11150 [SAR324 cluster bacterium]|nr:hypothetical protein [SAR324 cluster bacterium]
MGQKHYMLTEIQTKEYASGFLLDQIHNESRNWGAVLEGPDKDLEPLFIYMMSKDYIEIADDNLYHITPQGIEKLDNLKLRYEEYLSHFDIFSAVDLEEGTFAFEKFFEMDEDEWDDYIEQERFIDLRIAVAWFKKINPADFVFLNFLKEGFFDTNKDGWQFDLLSGLTWEQVENVVDQAVQLEDLGFKDDDGAWISGEVVIEDILTQGAKLNAKLHLEEEHLNQQDHIHDNDFSDENKETQFVTTHESYYDPFYISPIWFLF